MTQIGESILFLGMNSHADLPTARISLRAHSDLSSKHRVLTKLHQSGDGLTSSRQLCERPAWSIKLLSS